MARDSSQLKVELVGDASKLRKEMDGVSGRMQKLGQGMQSTGKTLTKFVTGPLVGAAAGMAGLATSAANTGDRLATTSDKIGVNTDMLQDLEYWASQNGVAQNQMEKAVGRLNQRVGMAAQGNEKYASALENLGVELRDNQGNVRDTDEILEETLTTLSNMEDSSEQVGLATELFGTKLTRDLLPALQEGSLSLEDAKQAMDEHGRMTEDQIDKAGEFSAQWDNLTMAGKNLSQQVGAELIPLFTDSLFPALEQHVIPAVKSTAETVGDLIEGFNDLPAPVKTATGGMTAFAAALGPILWTGGMVVSQVGKMTTGFHAARGAATKLNASLRTMRGTLLGGLGIGVTVAAVWDLKRAWEAAGEEAEAAVERIIKQSSSAEEAVRGIDSKIQTHRDELGSMQRAWSNVGNALTGPIGAFHSARNAISDASQQFNLMRGRSRAANDELQRTTEVIPGAREAVRRFEEGTHGLLGPLQQQIDKTRSVGDETDRLGTEMQEASDAATRWNEKLQQLNGSTINVEQAAIRWGHQINQLTQQLTENDKTLQMSIESGRANRRAILQTVEAAKSHAQAMIEDGASVDQATKALNTHIEELKHQMRQAGFTEHQVDSYIETLNLTPDHIRTLIEAETDQAESDLRSIHDLLNRLPKQKRTVVELATGTFGVPMGDGPGDVGAAGSAMERARALATGLPLRMTSGYRTPAENRAAGGSPTSHHLNRSNPASDWAGPSWAMREFVNRIQQRGDWREVLHPWNDSAHGDHVHVAHAGGEVSPTWPTLPGLRSDERPAITQVGERIVPKGGDGGSQNGDLDTQLASLAGLLAEQNRKLGRLIEAVEARQTIQVDREVLGEVVRDELHRKARDNGGAGLPV